MVFRILAALRPIVDSEFVSFFRILYARAKFFPPQRCGLRLAKGPRSISASNDCGAAASALVIASSKSGSSGWLCQETFPVWFMTKAVGMLANGNLLLVALSIAI